MKKIWILTLFPEYFDSIINHGVIGKLLKGERGNKLELNIIQISDFSKKSFKGVDSAPYGGGPGVIMRADILKEALFKGVIEAADYNPQNIKNELKIVYTAPRGIPWNNKLAKSYGIFFEEDQRDMVFICGRYEGIDERFLELYVDEVISIGDFVLSGGELAVMTVLDSSLRFVQGVLGNDESARDDSFEDYLIEGPKYTRPSSFENISVPEVLISGDHKKIQKFNHLEKISMTKKHRPDMYAQYQKIKLSK